MPRFENSWAYVAEYYGEYTQLIKTIEELAEFQQAFLSHSPAALVDEAADVLAMIEQIFHLVDYTDIGGENALIFDVYQRTASVSDLPELIADAIVLIAKSLNADNADLNDEICDKLLKIRFLIEMWGTLNKKKSAVGRRRNQKLKRQLQRIKEEEEAKS